MAHDELNLIAEASGGEVGKCVPQAAEAAPVAWAVSLGSSRGDGQDHRTAALAWAWRIAKAGANEQPTPAHRQVIDGVSIDHAGQGQAGGRQEDSISILGIGGGAARGSVYPIEHRGQDGNEAGHAACFAAAIVDGASPTIDHAPGQIRDIGIVEGAGQPQADPGQLLCGGGFSDRLNLFAAVCLPLAQPTIAPRLLTGLDEIPAVLGLGGNDALVNTPSDECLEVGHVAGEGEWAGPGEQLGKCGELVRSEAGDGAVGKHEAARGETGERIDGAPVVAGRDGGEGLGLARLHAVLQPLVEVAGGFDQADAADASLHAGYGGLLYFGIDACSLGLPLGINLFGRRALGADESGLAAIPSHPSVAVGREAREQAFRDAIRQPECGEPFGMSHATHCGMSLWASQEERHHSVKPVYFAWLIHVLKIHVSPVQFRPYPFQQTPSNPHINSGKPTQQGDVAGSASNRDNLLRHAHICLTGGHVHCGNHCGHKPMTNADRLRHTGGPHVR